MPNGQSSYKSTPSVDNSDIEKFSHDKDLAKASSSDTFVVIPCDLKYTANINTSCNSLDIPDGNVSPFIKLSIGNDEVDDTDTNSVHMIKKVAHETE